MPSSPPARHPDRERRLTRTGLGWRAGALATGTALALYGGLFGTDDLWPFAPMTQFAFYVSPDGEIRAVHVDAVTTGGEGRGPPRQPRPRQPPHVLRRRAGGHPLTLRAPGGARMTW